mmetsp:Transcript_115978/g.249195  ORF Transcript_115978/g.249195 Transcript_115978/m.249195 type:complete len:289 (-) Transcript_115978:53-919(-)
MEELVRRGGAVRVVVDAVDQARRAARRVNGRVDLGVHLGVGHGVVLHELDRRTGDIGGREVAALPDGHLEDRGRGGGGDALSRRFRVHGDVSRRGGHVGAEAACNHVSHDTPAGHRHDLPRAPASQGVGEVPKDQRSAVPAPAGRGEEILARHAHRVDQRLDVLRRACWLGDVHVAARVAVLVDVRGHGGGRGIGTLPRGLAVSLLEATRLLLAEAADELPDLRGRALDAREVAADRQFLGHPTLHQRPRTLGARDVEEGDGAQDTQHDLGWSHRRVVRRAARWGSET